MLVCPQCQFENPDNHRFCQGCGTSLTHKFCPQCGYQVSLDDLNCDNCGAETGQVWLAVVFSKQESQEFQESLGMASDVSEIDNDDRLMGGLHKGETLTSSTLDIITATPDNQIPATSENSGEDHEENSENSDRQDVPLSEDEELGLLEVFDPEDVRDVDKITAIDHNSTTALSGSEDGEKTAKCSESSITEGVYLDPQKRYKILESLPGATLGKMTVTVLDCQPLQVSPLATLDPSQWDSQKDMEALVIAAAQAYLALNFSYPRHFPKVHDAWEQDKQAIVLIEDYSHLPEFGQQWQNIEIKPAQIVAWLQEMTELWQVLEPWQCRQSLLQLDNLAVARTSDQSLCVKQLYSDDIEKMPTLADLGELWKGLFKLSGRTLIGSITEMLRDLKEEKFDRVEQLQLQLDKIMAELQPGTEVIEPTAPATDSSFTRIQASYQSQSSQSSTEISNAPTVPRLPQLLKLEAFGRTDVGRQRSRNEDSFGIQTLLDRQEVPGSQTLYARGLYILCDGMGGHAGGEVASRMAVSSIKQHFQTHWTDALPSEKLIRDAIIEANEAIYKVNIQGTRSGSGRMGTTLVLMVVVDTQVAIAHVGDSRLYRFTRSQGLEQITVDHEVGQREISRGIDADIAYTRPDAYQLTQALGPRDGNYLQPDIQFFDITEDTLLILASDGLTDNDVLTIHSKDHVEPLINPEVNLDTGVDDLINLANQHNGHDNITAIAVRALVHHSN